MISYYPQSFLSQSCCSIFIIPKLTLSPQSDTLSLFRANQSLLFLLNAVCLVENQQIPILESVVLPNRGSITKSTALEKSKDWLARNNDNVSDWGDMSICGLLFQ
jgi:hypothetical protein